MSETEEIKGIESPKREDTTTEEPTEVPAEVLSGREAVGDTKVSIGDRMKEYEKTGRSYIDPSLPAIMRIDGHSFSKFTRGLKKPYDEWVHKLMVEVTGKLMVEFNFVLGYTQSDEITLVFLPTFDKSGKLNDYPYANQIVKLTSLASAFATNCFTRGILKGIADKTIPLEGYEESTKQKLQDPHCFFDSRIFNVPSIQEVYSNIYWRSCYDCIKNSVSMLAYTVFPTKVTDGLHTNAKIKKLKEEKGIDWEKDYSNHFKFGTFVKKTLYEIPFPEEFTKFKKADKSAPIKRTQYIAFSLNFSGVKYSTAVEEFIFGKYLPDSAKAEDYPFKITEDYVVRLS